MDFPDSRAEADFSFEVQTFTHTLYQKGVHAALGLLNSRVPHRYTGLYRFDGEQSRNLHLFDRYDLRLRQGHDVPLAEAFCALVGREQTLVDIVDATRDPRAETINTLVVSYCGVPVHDEQGRLFGSLCHYDLTLCQEWHGHKRLLTAAAPLLYRALYAAP